MRDVLSSDLDKELKTEGYFIDKFVNYNSEKITELNSENKKLLKSTHQTWFLFTLCVVRKF